MPRQGYTKNPNNLTLAITKLIRLENTIQAFLLSMLWYVLCTSLCCSCSIHDPSLLSKIQPLFFSFKLQAILTYEYLHIKTVRHKMAAANRYIKLNPQYIGGNKIAATTYASLSGIISTSPAP
jgi:ABC-type transport system involved in cytochrome c biogenesis permease component